MRCAEFALRGAGGLLLAALLAGCGLLPPAPRVRVAPTVVAPEQVQRLVANATDEWIRWGSRRSLVTPDHPACLLQPDGDCVQVDDGCGDEQAQALCPVVDRYWQAVPPGHRRHSCGMVDVCAVHWPADDSRMPENTPPWSAVFVSAMMIKSGFSASEFWPSRSHAGYIVAARDGYASAFEVLPTPAEPSVGDVICATRGRTQLKPDEIWKILDGELSHPLHCDIVVAVDADRRWLQAIGGNVQQTVAMNQVQLDGQGRLAFDMAPSRPWLLILRPRRELP